MKEKRKQYEGVHPGDRGPVVIMEPEDARGVLSVPRAKADADADLAALAEALGVSEAEAARRAVRMALLAL